MSDADVVVIGAGVVGLACAAKIARAGYSVVVLEQHPQPGVETSSRNSGVIHAGLYYPAGSLKAVACVAGRAKLYERCSRFGLSHRRTGKIVVATTPEQIAVLESIRNRGKENGVESLSLITQAEARALEPDVTAVAALHSPETGIVDVHELMANYRFEAAEAGALFSFRTRVTELSRQGDDWEVLTVSTEGEAFKVRAPIVVNSAGLHAEQVAGLAGLDTERLGLRYHWCKGDYFVLSSRWQSRIRRLVYPVPVHAGLGVHLTLDMGGQLLAGPDTTYVDDLSYDVAEEKRALFAEAVRKYLPDLDDSDLTPGYAGIRPKLQGPGEGFRDFVLREESEMGAPGFINLLGIESPGLTSSEDLADRVLALL